jgi:hypothetical protein
MVEMTIGRAGGWYYPLYRRVGCRRWKWPVKDGEVIRFVSVGEVERFLGAMTAMLMLQGIWCLVLR